MKAPELVLINHRNGIPIAGGCAACPGVRFDLALIGSKEENRRMLEAMFEIHFQKVHSSPGEVAIHLDGRERTGENRRRQ